jgi:hypothetical protein
VCLSGTQAVSVHPYQYSADKLVYLIDTPGFDDSEETRTDADVLREISDWLAYSYKHGTRLSGIFYIHKVIQNRMPGSAIRNLAAFEKLIGDDPMKKVLFVTTFWDQTPLATAEKREAKLVEKYWDSMIQRGSTACRHNNTPASARNIIGRIVNGNGEKVTLDIQDELVNQKRNIIDTSAWFELQRDVAAKIATERAKLEEQFKERSKKASRAQQLELDQLREEIRENQRQAAEFADAQERLRVSAAQMMEDRERRYRQDLDQLRSELAHAREESRRHNLEMSAPPLQTQATSVPVQIHTPAPSQQNQISASQVNRHYRIKDVLIAEHVSVCGSAIFLGAGTGWDPPL